MNALATLTNSSPTATYRAVIGVVLATAPFRPALEPHYKPFCLTLLVGLASLGLARLAM